MARLGGFRLWITVSAAAHLALLLLVLLDLAPRRIPEPEEAAIPVELIAPVPAQMAQGDRPAPLPAPDAVPAPPRPDIAREPQRPQPVSPTPPPPPPPPAPAQAAQQAPPVPQQRTPTPPPPPPDPSAVAPVPPRPQQPQVAQQQPQPPTPARPTPQPPLPLPPSPTPPPPEPSRQAGTGQTPPVQRPEERSQSVLNTLERLRAQQQQQQTPPTARPNPAGAPAQGGGAPTGTASMTAAERSGVADKVSECFNVDAGAPGIRDIVVELRVEVDAGGNVRIVRPAGGTPSDPRARMVYESASRALRDPRCNPLPIPRGGIAALNAATFRFNPRDLGLR